MRRLAWLGLAAFGLTWAQASLAKTCELSIEGNDAMQFNKKELVVEAGCKEVKLTLKHSGKLPKSAMGHNWVLSLTKDKGALVTAGAKAGIAADYVPKDKKVIAATKLIGGGESTSVAFPGSKLKKGGDYTYFCSFPGHAALMVGKLMVK